MKKKIKTSEDTGIINTTARLTWHLLREATKIARSHGPWFPAGHLVTQRENLLCATADLLLQQEAKQIKALPSGSKGNAQADQKILCVSWSKKKKFYGENSSEEKWWATESSGCYFKYSGQVLAVCYPICLPYYNLSSRNQASHIESTKYTLNEGMKVAEGHLYQAVWLLEKPSKCHHSWQVHMWVKLSTPL